MPAKKILRKTYHNAGGLYLINKKGHRMSLGAHSELNLNHIYMYVSIYVYASYLNHVYGLNMM